VGRLLYFSHGGDYEYLASEQGFKLIRIDPIASAGFIAKYFIEHTDEDVIDIIKKEAAVYKESNIDALVQTNVFLNCKLAPRLAKIPLISVISGTLAPPYYKANYATYPDKFAIFLL
jgi:hypothetical protein